MLWQRFLLISWQLLQVENELGRRSPNILPITAFQDAYAGQFPYSSRTSNARLTNPGVTPTGWYDILGLVQAFGEDTDGHQRTRDPIRMDAAADHGFSRDLVCVPGGKHRNLVPKCGWHLAHDPIRGVSHLDRAHADSVHGARFARGIARRSSRRYRQPSPPVARHSGPDPGYGCRAERPDLCWTHEQSPAAGFHLCAWPWRDPGEPGLASRQYGTGSSRRTPGGGHLEQRLLQSRAGGGASTCGSPRRGRRTGGGVPSQRHRLPVRGRGARSLAPEAAPIHLACRTPDWGHQKRKALCAALVGDANRAHPYLLLYLFHQRALSPAPVPLHPGSAPARLWLWAAPRLHRRGRGRGNLRVAAHSTQDTRGRSARDRFDSPSGPCPPPPSISPHHPL